MSQLIGTGAMLTCSFGMIPGSFLVLPTNRTYACYMPAGTIMDHVPMLNIMPFGLCTSLSNPQVAAATSAAMGVLTPLPCMPVTTSPWTPGSPTVKIGNMSALNMQCKCMCAWAGVISVSAPGQGTVNVA